MYMYMYTTKSGRGEYGPLWTAAAQFAPPLHRPLSLPAICALTTYQQPGWGALSTSGERCTLILQGITQVHVHTLHECTFSFPFRHTLWLPEHMVLRTANPPQDPDVHMFPSHRQSLVQITPRPTSPFVRCPRLLRNGRAQSYICIQMTVRTITVSRTLLANVGWNKRQRHRSSKGLFLRVWDTVDILAGAPRCSTGNAPVADWIALEDP